MGNISQRLFPRGWKMEIFGSTGQTLASQRRFEWFALHFTCCYPFVLISLQIEGTACGLAYLHSKNVIHSDLKPVSGTIWDNFNILTLLQENILVSPLGEALLSDFGASRTVLSAISMRRSGSLKGTIAYNAPELMNFDTNDDDGYYPNHTMASDVWSFGMTVYVGYHVLTSTPTHIFLSE